MVPEGKYIFFMQLPRGKIKLKFLTVCGTVQEGK